MQTRIVVPLDGSAFGKRAIPFALALARRSDATVELVHVHEPPSTAAGAPAFDTRFDREERDRMRGELTTLATELAPQTGARVVARFLDGEVVPTLQRHLAESDARLAVMLTHGRGGLSRFWLGSVAEGVVRASPVPVLLLRAAAEWPGELREPFFRRVLLPVFDHAADGAADAAADADAAAAITSQVQLLMTPGETTLVLLAVIDPRVARIPATAGDPGTPASERGVERAPGDGDGDLAVLTDSLGAQGVEVALDELVARHPAPAILAYAEAHEIDLIVIATQAQDALGRSSHGAVLDKVVRGATVPVLVCRTGERSGPQDAPR